MRLSKVLVVVVFLSCSVASICQASNDFKILTFNTWHGISAGFFGVSELQEKPVRDQRIDNQLQALAKSNADVIVLQEVHPLNERVAQLKASLKDYDVLSMIENCGALWSKVEIGQVILAKKKFKLKKVEELTLLGKLHFDNGCENFSEVRRALFAEIEVGDKKWLIVGTHLSGGFAVLPGTQAKFQSLFQKIDLSSNFSENFFSKLLEDERERINQLQKIVKRVAELRSKFAGVFLAGDFNAVSGSPTFEYLKDENFVDLFDLHKNKNDRPEFVTTVESNNDIDPPFSVMDIDSELYYADQEKIENLLIAEERRPKRIDTVFLLSDKLKITSSTVQLLAPEYYEKGQKLSDHYGVIFNLSNLPR